MSLDNAALVRSALQAFNERDLTALLALMDEKVEALAQATALEGRYTGRAGIRQWWDDLLGAFPDWTIEVLDVREAGNLTLMAFEASGHAAGSGMPMTFRGWQVARWIDRRCVRWETFQTEEDALEAARLPE